MATSVQPDILHGWESVSARDDRHCRCHLSVLAPQGLRTPPLALGPLVGLRGPGRRGAGGLGAGGRQGIVILIKRPGDLVEGAGRRREVVIVGRALIAVHSGERVAGRFEGVKLLVVLQVQLSQPAVRRRFSAVATREHVAGLLRGVVVCGELLFPGLRQAVEAVQLGAHAIQTVREAVGDLLHRRVTPHKQIASRGLRETGTPAVKTET